MRRIDTKTEKFTLRENKAFNCYLSEVQKYLPLSNEEEDVLTNRIIEGDERAIDTLVKHNLRFVISVAKQYYGKNVSLEDLVNEGNMGLIMAARKFDPTRGFRFISYAVWWIRKSILLYLNYHSEVVRIPTHKTYALSKIKRAFYDLEQSLNRIPTESEVHVELNGEYDIQDVSLYFTTIKKNEKLDDYISDAEGSVTRLDVLENDVYAATDYKLVNEDSSLGIKNVLTLLENNNQRVVIMRTFGLDGREPEPLETIGTDIGLGKERVRQIRDKSLRILKGKMDLNKFSDIYL